jgi:class 3 adenylate cyclase
VLKFIGDGLLAIFPVAPEDEGAACNAALSAVRAARDGMAGLDRERLNVNLPPLPFGVGLHQGPVVYGNIGAKAEATWLCDYAGCAAFVIAGRPSAKRGKSSIILSGWPNPTTRASRSRASIRKQ